MQILGLLGMYFNAVVVEVKTFLTFIQIDSGHTVSPAFFSSVLGTSTPFYTYFWVANPDTDCVAFLYCH